MTGFLALLGLTRVEFTAPSFSIFTDLLTGWVCAPGRRTITAMIKVADPAGRRAHDAYHRFVRDGAWSMHRLWQALAVHLIARFAPTGTVELACDDTLFHHQGRRVNRAGTFRDAVRSTLGRVVYARGLNLVVLTLQVRPLRGGCSIGGCGGEKVSAPDTQVPGHLDVHLVCDNYGTHKSPAIPRTTSKTN